MSNRPAPLAQMRIERNRNGQPVRVYVGHIDITHLVARVQSNTSTLLGTTQEVVLTVGLTTPPAVGLPL